MRFHLLEIIFAISFLQITGWRYDSKRRTVGNLVVAGNQARTCKRQRE